MNLVERIAATQKTVDAFKGKTFADGKADCIQLVRTHAKHMGVKIAVPRYGDTKSAASTLRKLGFKTLGEAMDHRFRRIERHEIMAADIVEVPGENGFSSLMIAVGNGRTIGFHQSIPHADILQPVLISGAWRID